MNKVAIYPGTFDPITSGHIDIIQRAAQVFDQIIVIVACNTRKSTWLTVEQRVTLVKEALSESNVRVMAYDGVIVDLAIKHQATAIVRGLRTSADYENEFQLAGMNRLMAPQIQTVFFPACTEHAFISATLVREIWMLGGDISPFVPQSVLQQLKQWDSSSC